MHRPTRLKLTDLNPHFTCVLCDGYLVDATTIIECLHSFCRTCIVRYLENSRFCPVCDVQVHKTKPLLSIRSDKTLQDIVYKLVPGLYQNEMKRRREFYAEHPKAAAKCSSEERGEGAKQRFIYAPDENISLSLEYVNGAKTEEEEEEAKSEEPEKKEPQRRYLRCPAAVSVWHLKKFVTMKFSLPPSFKVNILYSDDVLNDEYTLMDIAYIYAWRRAGPMRFYYNITKCPPKKRPLPPPLVEKEPEPEVSVSEEPAPTLPEPPVSPKKSPPLPAEEVSEVAVSEVAPKETELPKEQPMEVTSEPPAMAAASEQPTVEISEPDKLTIDDPPEERLVVDESPPEEPTKEETPPEESSEPKEKIQKLDIVPPKSDSPAPLPPPPPPPESVPVDPEPKKVEETNPIATESKVVETSPKTEPRVKKSGKKRRPKLQRAPLARLAPYPPPLVVRTLAPTPLVKSIQLVPATTSAAFTVSSTFVPSSEPKPIEVVAPAPLPKPEIVIPEVKPKPIEEPKKEEPKVEVKSKEKEENRETFEQSVKNSISAEFSEDEGQQELVVDERKSEDDLRKKITAIAEKEDDDADSGRASDVSSQARSSCDDADVGSPSAEPEESGGSKLENVISHLYHRAEKKDVFGALDLSTSCKQPLPSRSKTVANPVLDFKHRQQSYLPAPRQHTACTPPYLHPLLRMSPYPCPTRPSSTPSSLHPSRAITPIQLGLVPNPAHQPLRPFRKTPAEPIPSVSATAPTSPYKHPPPPLYKKTDSYKTYHRFKGANLTVINPDPNGYRQKIVIKNLDFRPNNHQRI